MGPARLRGTATSAPARVGPRTTGRWLHPAPTPTTTTPADQDETAPCGRARQRRGPARPGRQGRCATSPHRWALPPTGRPSPAATASAIAVVSWTAILYTVDDHTLALKTDGTLWAWGANDYGQLGARGGGRSSRRRQQVGTDTTWTSIAVGDDYSAARKSDGTLWAWGRNQFGQLGHGGDTTLRGRADSGVTGSGVDTFTAFACGSGRDASQLAVKKDGSLWGWGNNSAGELRSGRPGVRLLPSPGGSATASSWAKVACGSSFGDNFSLAMTTSGELYAWGGNFRGRSATATTWWLYEPARSPRRGDLVEHRGRL